VPQVRARPLGANLGTTEVDVSMGVRFPHAARFTTADGPLKPSFGLSGALPPVSRSKTRPSSVAHLVKSPLSVQKSPNPFRMLSLRSMYVHSCMENNILFAYYAPRAHKETSIPSFITRRSVRLIFVW
jgi:hypothetical protein